MKLTFCGGAQSVTGACYLLETEHTKLLVDCGMFQGSRFAESLNYDPFPFDPKTVQAVFITHAHIDHVGRLPKLYRDGFRGVIYATEPTIDFAREMLFDSERVIKHEARWEGIEPFYSAQDVAHVFSLTKPTPYGVMTELSQDVSYRLYEAEHILGSAMVELFVKQNGATTKIVFSGDLGNSHAPLLRDMHKEKEADFAVIESTYGNKLHEVTRARKDTLEDIIEETIAKGGTLMIPSFAAERTQELLYELNELVEHGRIPRVPVFIDSPLAIKITQLYKKHVSFYDSEAATLVKSGDEIFNFPGLKFTPTVEDSKAINAVPPPKIILAGFGMSQGGRIVYHEKLYLSDPKNTLLIIGYQVKGSLGRRLLDGEQTVKIAGAQVQVRARVIQISGYSAHADQKKLMEWIEPMRLSLKKLFVVQGEEESAQVLAQKVKDEFAVDAVVPRANDSFEL
ncbi:MBL fold metallo-hydrolase [Candidatus Azambacteria bacterium]|nr:MBL fold metallo-hydrolase [Candidatus Azambacteria bacterium]